LKKEGSFFLNMGCSSKDPWISIDVACQARHLFKLQNHIIWAKSISINEESWGHFSPINSNRYLNSIYEDIYHFTITGSVPVDRLAIGVPYVDKSNLTRWQHKKKNMRCRGDIWYISYDTIKGRQQKARHPAIFPIQLARNCIKLHGIKPDITMLDPFAGIGNSLMAAQGLGINAIGIEIDTEYAKVAKRKLGLI
jgi:site-specific DNA-methyltransferase (adenine-specific)